MNNYKKEEISEEDMVKHIMEKRNEILDAFCKAYLAESGLKPSKIELVHTSKVVGEEIINTFSFREKSNEV